MAPRLSKMGVNDNFDFHADEPLGEERHPWPNVWTFEGADGGSAREAYAGQPQHKGSTRRNGSPNKTALPQKVWRRLEYKDSHACFQGSPGRKFSLYLPAKHPKEAICCNAWASRIQMPLLMDKAYEGDENRRQAQAMGLNPVVPPKKSRKDPWKYDRERYKKRNEVERLFWRWKGDRRVFSRFAKQGVIFMKFIAFALIGNMLR